MGRRFTMLPDAGSVEALLLGGDGGGILRRAPAGTLFADCSTTGAEAARKIAKAAAERDLLFWTRRFRAAWPGRRRESCLFWWAARNRRWSARARVWKKWARQFFTPGRRARGRRRKCATTCCFPF